MIYALYALMLVNFYLRSLLHSQPIYDNMRTTRAHFKYALRFANYNGRLQKLIRYPVI